VARGCSLLNVLQLFARKFVHEPKTTAVGGVTYQSPGGGPYEHYLAAFGSDCDDPEYHHGGRQCQESEQDRRVGARNRAEHSRIDREHDTANRTDDAGDQPSPQWKWRTHAPCLVLHREPHECHTEDRATFGYP